MIIPYVMSSQGSLLLSDGLLGTPNLSEKNMHQCESNVAKHWIKTTLSVRPTSAVLTVLP